jgi:hypothetical protein
MDVRAILMVGGTQPDQEENIAGIPNCERVPGMPMS